MKNEPGRRVIKDMRDWISWLEQEGQLSRVKAKVDWDEEMGTIARRAYDVYGDASPALLFENIKGHPGHKALYNTIGCNLSRFCLTIGVEPVDHPLKAVQLLQQKLGRKMAPVTVPAENAI